MLKVGTLEIPLDELDADVLEVGLLRIIRGKDIAEFSLSSESPSALAKYIYELSNDSFPPNRFVLPGGPAVEAAGTAVFTTFNDGSGKLATSVTGLRKINSEGGFYEGWLIHDLLVPEDLAEADYETLPKGSDGEGNQKGQLFTVDGRKPSTGNNSQSNTIWVPVSTGTFNTDDDSNQKAYWDFGFQTNWTFSPLEMIGVTVRLDDREDEPRDPDCLTEKRLRLIPSGLTRNILTDVFIRTATVYPELQLVHNFAQRLISIYSDYVSRYDSDGDGLLAYADVNSAPECFIAPQDFNRIAITREVNEGWLGPRFVPSQKAYVLAGERT